MKPKLKDFDCTDHDPIDLWRPADRSMVDYWLCLHIGPEEEEYADIFYVNVISEKAVRKLTGSEAKKRKKLVITSYSWPAVIENLNELIEKSKATDWDTTIQNLREHFDWEYDNYKAG